MAKARKEKNKPRNLKNLKKKLKLIHENHIKLLTLEKIIKL